MSSAELVRDVPTQASVFHHILLATDFSPASERALMEALILAKENDAQISVVHVLHTDWRYEMLDPPELVLEQIDARERMGAFLGKFAPRQNIPSNLIKHGPIAESVVSVALLEDADLLVIGTRGRGGLSKLALGSTAEELLRVAPCPVLTVGPKAELVAGKTCGHAILFATDFGKGSAKALTVALSIAQKRGAKLILLHMTPPMPVAATNLSAYAPAGAVGEGAQQWEASSRARCLQQLKSWLPSGLALAQEPEYVVGTELCPEGILAAASRFNVDLIVMGANQAGSAKVLAHIPWTAVHEVVCKAPCPVLTVAG